MKNKYIKWFLRHSLTVISCALIASLGIAFVVWSSPQATIIGEDITTRNITASGDVAVSGSLEAKTGRTVTLVVAASNSATTTKAQADFVADGVDDQITIQDAINALPAGGGKVALMEGTFIITPDKPIGGRLAGIIVPSNVTLKGQGESTVLRLVDNFPHWNYMIVTGEGAKDVHIKSLRIDQNALNQPGPPFPMMYGVALRGARYSIVENVYIDNISYSEPITLKHASHNVIVNNVIEGSFGDCINLTVSSHNVITGNVLTGVVGVAGHVPSEAVDIDQRSNYNVITDNVITGTMNGIGLRGLTRGNILQNNNISDTVHHGIYMRDTGDAGPNSHNIIKGNFIARTGFHGIDINHKSEYNIISDNMIATPTLMGIRIRGEFNYNTIENNIISGSLVGISMNTAQNNYNKIDGNIISGSKEDGIRIQGGINGANHLTITNNQVIASGFHGILLRNVRRSLVSGNQVKASGQIAHNTYTQIVLHTGSTNNLVTNNIIHQGTYTNKPRMGIALADGANDNIVINNDLREAGIHLPALDSGARNLFKENEGLITENSGIATFSGDGTTTTFTFAHGLRSPVWPATPPTPTVILEAKSADAAGDKHWSADATNITITFITAPPAGTNNVVISWEAKVR